LLALTAPTSVPWPLSVADTSALLTPTSDPVPTSETIRPTVPASVPVAVSWAMTWALEKREGDWTGSQIAAGIAPRPYETMVVKDNGLLNNGIDNLLMRLIGGPGDAYPPYASGSAHIKVGDGTAAFSASHTDLQGTNVAESPMDHGYPTVSATTVTWKSTFGAAVANFSWEEVGVKNASGPVSSTVRLLNRRVQSFGTKVSGSTWTMTLSITVS